MERIVAPWTDDEVRNLNSYQSEDRFHPFTCGNNRSDEAHRKFAKENDQHDLGLLVASRDGWHCPVPGCGYSQFWAHKFMAQEQPLR